MKRWFQLVVLALLVLGTQGSLQAAGQVLDRVVAKVNDGVILESEWDDALRYECFLNRKSPEQLTAVERRATLERLIDQLLLAQQMEATGFTHASTDEVNERIHQIRQEIPAGATEAGSGALRADG